MSLRVDEYRTVVVGAGPSGLYAARLLKQQYPDVLVVEAQNHVGGRIRQLHGFTGWPIEVGPEFVHGAHSKLTEVMNQYGLSATEKPWPDYWYFGKEKRLTDNEGVATEVDELHELFENVGAEVPPPAGQDVTAEAWLRSKGATDLQLEVADVCYANDFGCNLKQLGLREMITENNKWDSGETYLILDKSMSHLVNNLRAGLDIRTSFPIKSITYDNTGAILTGPNGAKLGCRKVIITAPLAVLQQERIAFRPALPAAKTAAVKRIRMGNAAKIIIAFNQRFWPERLYDVICTHTFVPEFWMTQHEVVDQQNKALHAVVGFLAGPRADALAHITADQAVQQFLDQLDEIFGSPANPQPASSSYVKGHVFDWSREEYIGGAYTFPSYGAEDGDRQALAAPVAGTLFFAGRVPWLSAMCQTESVQHQMPWQVPLM
eukprot:GHUV01029188.1.p1 GENE.GHUV01029188.1~~GHUV01029188.1.p1  ORF type:complete len:433 (+),score=137.10 GHUV01029188.1:367-1665(+)